MDQYQRLEEIGSDHNGAVYKYRDVRTNKYIYIRTIDWLCANAERKVRFLMETEHQNVVKLLNIVDGPENTLHLISEYTGPNLTEFMDRYHSVARHPIIIKWFLFQILCGISHYHRNNLCHGFLNPQNVLINYSTFQLKIAHIAVTPSCKAPELLLGFEEHIPPVDIWSVGCIFAEMVNQKPLFPAATDFNARLRIFRTMGRPTEETWPGVTKMYKTMPGVTKMYKTINEYPRMDPMDLTSFFPSLEPAGMDLLLKMLCMNPSERINVYDALEHDYMKDAQLF